MVKEVKEEKNSGNNSNQKDSTNVPAQKKPKNVFTFMESTCKLETHFYIHIFLVYQISNIKIRRAGL